MLINLEGIDGCGKSTQSQFLMEKFESDNEKTILLKEPTNGKYGQMLWNMLSGKIEATTEEILELFVLDRKEHVNKKIKPALDEGKIVLMDRYYYSTMAYQAAEMKKQLKCITMVMRIMLLKKNGKERFVM